MKTYIVLTLLAFTLLCGCSQNPETPAGATPDPAMTTELSPTPASPNQDALKVDAHDDHAGHDH